MIAPPAAPDATYAALVLDDDGVVVRRFRSTSALPPLGALDGTGLGDLRCSGSAQPSVRGHHDLLQRLGEVPREDVYVVDLRQESHGFLNDAAVSWYAQRNWGASGLTDEEAMALEALRLRLLELAPVVGVGRAEAVKRGEPAALVAWTPSRVACEKRALGLAEGRYVRLPVTDHACPSDSAVDRFVSFVRDLPAGAHVHVHCRGGKGRTSTFMALYDMLRNASRVPLATILARQARISDYDLAKAADPAEPKAPFIADRLALLEQFHEYARSNPRGAPVPWSAWIVARRGRSSAR